MNQQDPGHWLYRLSPEEWIQAAENEIRLARAAFASSSSQHRPAVTHARRAAGMALNAILWSSPDPAYGRSYMDHLKGLAEDAGVPVEIRGAGRRLLDMPIAQQVVVLGKAKDSLADPAEAILGYVRGVMAPVGRG